MNHLNAFDPSVDRVLLIGVGGGYDVFTCLPWYLQLSQQQKDACVLANYSFTDDLSSYDSIDQGFIKVDPLQTEATSKNFNYFPELHLALKIGVPVYAIRLIPCPQLIDIIDRLIVDERITKVYAFDGGVDSIIMKPESDGEIYGSPLEDSQMVLALNHLSQNHPSIDCLLITSALSIDDCDVQLYCKNWETMMRSGGALGKFDVTSSLYGWNVYQDIVRSCEPSSIIQECILEAGNGRMGLYVNPRLCPSRIDDPSDFPLITNDTKSMWVWQLNQVVSKSEFYQYLLTQLNQMDSKMDQVNEMWIKWNRLINQYLYKT